MKIDTALARRFDAAALTTDATPLRPAARLWLRRLSFWGPICGVTVLGTGLGVIATAGVGGPLRWPLLVLLALNLLYMALTGTPAVIGFVLHLAGRRMRVAARPSGLARTALLMPVHCEDPRAVFAAIGAMARSMAEAGLQNIDMFVLSDTQDGRLAAAEKAAFDATAAQLPADGPGLLYRRRTNNAGRKVGNLADFCGRWGDEYDYMLVLDADSLMGASAIGTLIGLMDANPRTGIIQTVPYPVGRESLFARLQQFGSRLYTPLLVEGLTFWQGTDGNYWGHNAIVRIAPFRAHCAVPVLKGSEPWGGEILCHDVVEAGLMRGAGWDVWVLPQVMESFEAVPANLVDFAARERRWCQGNLQHSRVLPMPGFRPVGRFHLAYGIAHYLAGPLALLFLVGASLDAAAGGGFASALLRGPAGLGLIALAAVALYAGKVTSLLAVLADPGLSRRFGGRAALLGGAVLEQAAACVISALMIVFYARFVVELVRGRTVRWDPQPRDDRGVSWREGWLRTRGPVLIGVAWLLLLPLMPGGVRGWTLPLLLGLLGSFPMAVLSSRVSLGALARRFGLLLTPEETAPAPVLRTCARAMPVVPAPDRASGKMGVLQLVPSGGEAQ